VRYSIIGKIVVWKSENFPGVAVAIQGSSLLESLFDVVVCTDEGESARSAPVRAPNFEGVDNDVLEVAWTRRNGRPALPRDEVLLCSNNGGDLLMVIGKTSRCCRGKRS
jgi:hypothetical protein